MNPVARALWYIESHVVERDFLPEVAFDVPERSCDWVHNFSRQHDASISTGLIADLIAIAVPSLSEEGSSLLQEIVTSSLHSRG